MRRIKEKVVEAVNYYNSHKESVKNVASQFGIDKDTLRKYLKEDLSGIIYVPDEHIYVQLTKVENDAIEKYVSKEYPSIEFAARKVLKTGRDTFLRMCKYKGIEIYKVSPYKYIFNRKALKNIETEEDAYILGFFTADAYINKANRYIKIRISSCDEDVLIKINKYLESNCPIVHIPQYKTTKPVSELIFNDKEFTETMISHGVIQRKSGKETFCNNVPPELVKHYIRGLIDGDGYILKSRKIIGLCGSEDICTNIRDILSQNLNLDFGNKYQVTYNKKGHIYFIRFSGETAVKIMQYLYQDSKIYLDRKFDLAKRFFDEK